MTENRLCLLYTDIYSPVILVKQLCSTTRFFLSFLFLCYTESRGWAIDIALREVSFKKKKNPISLSCFQPSSVFTMQRKGLKTQFISCYYFLFFLSVCFLLYPWIPLLVPKRLYVNIVSMLVLAEAVVCSVYHSTWHDWYLLTTRLMLTRFLRTWVLNKD